MKIIFTDNIKILSKRLSRYIKRDELPILMEGYMPTDGSVSNIAIPTDYMMQIKHLTSFMAENIALLKSYIKDNEQGESMWAGRGITYLKEASILSEHLAPDQLRLSKAIMRHVFAVYDKVSHNYHVITRNAKFNRTILHTPAIESKGSSIIIGYTATEAITFATMVFDEIQQKMGKELKNKHKKTKISDLKNNNEQVWIYAISPLAGISEQMKRNAHEKILGLLAEHQIESVTFIDDLHDDNETIVDMEHMVQYAIRGIEFNMESKPELLQYEL